MTMNVVLVALTTGLCVACYVVVVGSIRLTRTPVPLSRGVRKQRRDHPDHS
jgi:hypothetical protein